MLVVRTHLSERTEFDNLTSVKQQIQDKVWSCTGLAGLVNSVSRLCDVTVNISLFMVIVLG